eukprot:1187937-Prorocentrum_minimum.AAC.2
MATEGGAATSPSKIPGSPKKPCDLTKHIYQSTPKHGGWLRAEGMSCLPLRVKQRKSCVFAVAYRPVPYKAATIV